MRISDRAIGYLSLLALLLIFILVSYGMYKAHKNVSHTALVDFEELGSLQPEDDVVVRGYKVGSIGKVTWLHDRSRIEIKFSVPITIREGTQFNNVNYALMGQRRLEIVPSKTGAILPENYIHKGTFEPGIAEALRFMEDVNRQLTHVRNALMLIAKGDSTHVSAQELYESAMNSLEKFLVELENISLAAKPKIDTVFSEIEKASEVILDVSQKADSTINTASLAINTKIGQADTILRNLSQGVAQINSTITELQKSPAVDKLMNSKDAITKINSVISKVNVLIAAIDTKGIKVLDENGNRVKLFTWKNTNLLGKTARQKAEIRAQKGERLPE